MSEDTNVPKRKRRTLRHRSRRQRATGLSRWIPPTPAPIEQAPVPNVWSPAIEYLAQTETPAPIQTINVNLKCDLFAGVIGAGLGVLAMWLFTRN